MRLRMTAQNGGILGHRGLGAQQVLALKRAEDMMQAGDLFGMPVRCDVVVAIGVAEQGGCHVVS